MGWLDRRYQQEKGPSESSLDPTARGVRGYPAPVPTFEISCQTREKTANTVFVSYKSNHGDRTWRRGLRFWTLV